MGTAFKQIVPYRTFPTADRDIAVAVASDKLWAAFCRAIGKPELTADPRYATNPLRVRNRGELEPMLLDLFRQRPCREWQQRLDEAGVPCTPVRTLEEVCADPQSEARDLFPTLPHPTAGPARVTGTPVKMSGTPGRTRYAAPLLGQHTRAVLHSLLCLDKATLDRLAAEKIIVCHQP
jgi:crotonobetainyl-CoA:carnitine CoA-transferase CaiB-like acyl-CoA transferase